MEIEFTSTPEYRKKHAHFYEAISELLKDQKAKINVNSVTKLAGYNRSAIRKDRAEWIPLLEDIEIANNFQQKKPHFVAIATLERSKAVNANAKEYKSKYLNILSAFYDLSRIVKDQDLMIKHLELENSEKSEYIIKLKQEIDTIKSNGKVVSFLKKK